MRDCLPSESEIFRRLSLYGYLSTEEQGKLFAAASCNNSRIIGNSLESAFQLIAQSSKSLKPCFQEAASLDITESNWIERLLEVERSLINPGSHPLQRSYALNMWMVRNGLCPLLQYAFDEWHQLDGSDHNFSVNKIKNIAELSTAYLYRLIELNPVIKAPILGEGSYNYVVQHGASSVAKIPRNLAAKDFINHQEINANQAALKTGLRKYLPDILSYDEDTGVIIKDLVDGKIAWDLLGSPDFRSAPYALNQVKDIYLSACSLYKEEGINLDIHPGNFCWSDSKGTWFLIDAGPMPQIGASYYPRAGFEEYFKKIWLDLHRLVAEVPIRSVDLDFVPVSTAIQNNFLLNYEH